VLPDAGSACVLIGLLSQVVLGAFVQPEQPALLQARAAYRNIPSGGVYSVITVLVPEPL
jgi:hypothetical protein